MANQPGDINEPVYRSEGAAHQTYLLPAVRTTHGMGVSGMGRCPNCGATILPGTSICPECGELLRAKAKKIRCRRCGHRTSSSLVICPHCGRDLMPAPPRLLLWGAPGFLVVLFLTVLVGRWHNGNLVVWTQKKVTSGVFWVKALGDSLAPTVNVSVAEITPTPIALVINTQKQNQASATNKQNGQITNDQTQHTSALESPAIATLITQTVVVAVAPVTPTATTADMSTQAPTAPVAVMAIPTLQPTATFTPSPDTPTPTAIPTKPPTATSTARATSTPTTIHNTLSTVHASLVIVPTETPTGQAGMVAANQTTAGATTTKTLKITGTALPTNTPLPPSPTSSPTAMATNTSVASNTYEVQSGDTLNAIANRFNTNNQAIMDANGLTTEDVYRLHPGQKLIIPSTVTAGAPTVTAAATRRTYTIQAGDTPIEIANTYGISVADLLATNNLSTQDVRNLRVGQVLIIPDNGKTPANPTVQSTPTPQPSPQATAASVSAASAGEAKIRLDAPQLRSPENNVAVSCSSRNALIWQAVQFMLDSDRFVLHLGFVIGYEADGKETIRWILEQIQSPSNTSWNMDTNLCALAPQALGRQWRWYVEVVDVNHTSVSPPSSIWGFSWN